MSDLKRDPNSKVVGDQVTSNDWGIKRSRPESPGSFSLAGAEVLGKFGCQLAVSTFPKVYAPLKISPPLRIVFAFQQK